MSHFVQTFVWRNGWVSGLLWDIDGFVMKFLAMPRRSERRYLPRLGVQNGNLPQNGCGEKKRTACHTSASAAAYTYALTSCTNVLPRRRASVDACRVRASSTRARAQITTAPRRAVRLATRGARRRGRRRPGREGGLDEGRWDGGSRGGTAREGRWDGIRVIIAHDAAAVFVAAAAGLRTSGTATSEVLLFRSPRRAGGLLYSRARRRRAGTLHPRWPARDIAGVWWSARLKP